MVEPRVVLGEHDWRTMRTLSRKLVLMASILALIGALTPVASAGPASCETRNNNTIAKLLECVDVDGVREHQAALQAIADANDGTRASGTPGYDASVDYVVDRMENAGYQVTVQPFEFDFSAETAIVERLDPDPRTYLDFAEVDAMAFSGEGDVTALLEAVDLSIDDPAASTSACEAADFAGFTAGNIAFAQRGFCSFAQKAANAEAAGASALIVTNQGTTTPEDRTGMFFGTLGAPGTAIPVVSMHWLDGLELVDLLGAGPVTMRVSVDVESGVRTSYNVFAERTGKNADNVVMAGGHLDSVVRGPGIQDNGSGSAALLEVAEQMAKVRPQNTLRFAWWGSEEFGLLGSIHYVENLSQEELDEIALYLNFDMVGSPNHVFFIYDGDDSDGVGAGPGPAGSDLIEEKFEEFFDSRSLPYKGTDFSGRSDYGPFIAAGVPSGGLFTGAEGIKTDDEVALWGGVAGEQYDQCYHLACDTFDNVNLFALDTNSDAIAFATLSYAMSTELIDGEKSKGNFKPGKDPFAPETS
jgi:Zn-dependent M28 family amino/carboxypeptidase